MQREQIRSELFLQSAIINPAGMRLLLIPRQAAAWLRWRQWRRRLPHPVRTSLHGATPSERLGEHEVLAFLHLSFARHSGLEARLQLINCSRYCSRFIAYSVFGWNRICPVAVNGTAPRYCLSVRGLVCSLFTLVRWNGTTVWKNLPRLSSVPPTKRSEKLLPRS